MIKEGPQNSLIRVPYDNYKIFHPDGTLMCFCSKKKANWYIKHNLAEVIENNEFKIQLKFIPKGYGDPLEILVGRSNACVVTNTTKLLTKHHIVPTQYRQHFRATYKDKNSCDLAILCRKEHDIYEDKANDFKVLLYNDYIDDNYKNINKAWSEAKSLYNSINKYFNKIPDERQVYMLCRLEGLIQQWNFTDKELNDRILKGSKDYNKIIVEKIGTVNLIVLWKLHFLKFAKPKHLPKWWKPNLIKVINKLDHNKKTDLLEIKLIENEELMILIKKYNLYEIASLYL